MTASMKFTGNGDPGGLWNWYNMSEAPDSPSTSNDCGFSGTGSPVYVNSGPVKGSMFIMR